MILYNNGESLNRLSAEDLYSSSCSLSESFLNYSSFIGVAADPKVRMKFLQLLFTIVVKVAAKFGMVIIIRDDENRTIGAVTLYEYRDKKEATFFRIMRSNALPLALKAMTTVGLRGYIKFLNFTETVSKEHLKIDMGDNPVYLQFAGISPEFQNRGFLRGAMALIKQKLKEKNYTALYLETGDPENITVYGKFGFEVLENTVYDKNGERIYFMRLPLQEN